MGYDKRGRPKLKEPKTQHNLRLIAHYGELLKPNSPLIAWRREQKVIPMGIQQLDKLTRPWNPSTLMTHYLQTEMDFLVESHWEWLYAQDKTQPMHAHWYQFLIDNNPRSYDANDPNQYSF